MKTPLVFECAGGWVNELTRQSLTEEMQLRNEYLKKCSISVVVKGKKF